MPAKAGMTGCINTDVHYTEHANGLITQEMEFMTKTKMTAIAVSLLFFSSVSLAATHPMISLTMGGSRANVSNNTNIIFIPPFYNNYDGSSIYDTEALGGIFMGAQTDINSVWAWQYGVSYYQNSSFQAHGVVNQFGDPAFANLNYYYQIQSRRYLVETKILATVKQSLHPYVDLGVGQSVNKSYNYNEQAITSDAVPMSQPFANRTMRNFTYLIGLGVDVDITQHVRLGAGYRYVDLGKAGLNPSPLQQDSTQITNTRIRANELLMQLSLIS